MSSKLNTENYESVFFRLLENEYNKEEANQLLEEINNDPFYAFEWECWKKAIISDQSEELAEEHAAFFANIKEEIDVIALPTATKRILPLYQIITTIAACLIVGIGLYLFFNQNDKPTERLLSSHSLIKNKTVIIDSVVNISIENSILPKDKNVIVNSKSASGIVSNVMKFKETNDPLLTFDKSKTDIPPLFISKKSIGPIEYEITHDVHAIAMSNRSAYKRKFTVSKSDTLSAEKIIALSELEANNTNLIKLLDNKRITMVKVDGKLYVRLIEENEKTILVSLK